MAQRALSAGILISRRDVFTHEAVMALPLAQCGYASACPSSPATLRMPPARSKFIDRENP